MNANLERAIKYLIDNKPFYAQFFLNSKVVLDKYNVPTAAAAVTKDSTLLIFNTEFLNKMTPAEVAGIVEHEVLHLLFEHTSEVRETNNAGLNYAKNIAMDCAINQYIPNIPEGGITLPALSKMLGKELLEKQTWEYYFDQLKQSAQEAYASAKTSDCHDADIPGQLQPGSSEAKQVLRNTTDTAIKAAKGDAPEHVTKAFGELTAKAQIPWRQVLSNFIARSTSSSTQATRKRANRRFGFEVPGKKKKRELTLGVCVDSSGSISDDAYMQFLAEIQRITPNCSKVHVLEADCEVQSIETLKKGKSVQLRRTGNGGTAYQPAISKCLELGCDAIIYFGDFDSSDNPANPGKPFLWVGVGTQDPPGDFGSVLRLK